MKSFAALAALAACALIVSACATVSPPIETARPVAPVAPTDFEAHMKPESLATERAKLAQWRQLARRNDRELYVFRRGELIAKRISDPEHCEGFHTCELWLFDGGLRLLSPDGGLEDFAQLIFEQGEGGNQSVIRPDGTDLWIGAHGLASPDGRWIAAGESEVNELDDGNVLTLTDWRGKSPQIGFTPSCRPLAWQGNDHFTALCQYFANGVPVTFDGAITHGADGAWTLRQTQLHGKNGEALAPGPEGLKTFPGAIVKAE